MNKWIQSLTPSLGFHPSFSAGWLCCLTPSLLGLLRHTHSYTHTYTNPKTLPHRLPLRVSVVQHGVAAVRYLQLTWSSLDGEPVESPHLFALTGDISSLFTMESGRVWSRYQRTVLITMMMFKLGRFLFPTTASALCLMQLITSEQGFQVLW